MYLRPLGIIIKKHMKILIIPDVHGSHDILIPGKMNGLIREKTSRLFVILFVKIQLTENFYWVIMTGVILAELHVELVCRAIRVGTSKTSENCLQIIVTFSILLLNVKPIVRVVRLYSLMQAFHVPG